MRASVAVLGAGSWGTALALQLARNGQAVRLWGHDPAHRERLREERCNNRYLPGIAFPDDLTIAPSLAAAVTDADHALIATPSHAFAALLDLLVPTLDANCGFAWATKGLEHGGGRFLHELVSERLGTARPAAVVSGPSFAREVARGMPTALTVASRDAAHAHRIAALLHGGNMRVYTSQDVVGVELGGALKNVLAIATGVADGLGFGANARAALITRGLAEMVRLGQVVGGQRETFMGLTGVGDLVLTCTDDQSRNRRFGIGIGQGQTAAAAYAAIGQVVEGAHAVREILRIARRHGVTMPISEQVERVIHEGLAPRRAVEALLSRDIKPETG